MSHKDGAGGQEDTEPQQADRHHTSRLSPAEQEDRRTGIDESA